MSVQSSKKIIPWIIASLFFMEGLDESIISTSIPKMASSLGVNPISLKAAIISYLISLAIIMPVSGWFAERWGTRRIILMAVTIFLFGSLCCGLSSSLNVLVISRVIQGVGGAFMAPVGRMVMLYTFKKQKIVKAMNYVIIPGLVGAISGPIVGGLIVSFFSWRFIFFINIPFCFLALYFIATFIPNFRSLFFSKRFDWSGFVLLAIGLGGLSLLMEGAGKHYLLIESTGIFMLVFVLSLVGCYLTSRKKRHPIVEFSLFKLQSFRTAAVATVFIRIGIASIFFLLPLMYQIAFGWPPWQSGLMMVPFIVGTILIKLLTPAILKKFGMKKVLLVGNILIVCIVMSFSLITQDTELWKIGVLSFIMGGCTTTFFTACHCTAYSELDGSKKMSGISIYTTIQRVSTCVGVGVTAFVLEQMLAGSELAVNVKVSVFHDTFLIVALPGLISLFLFMSYPANIGSAVSGHVCKE